MDELNVVLKLLPWLVPSVQPIMAMLMGWRLIAKPVVSLILKVIEQSETPDDNIWVGKLIAKFRGNVLGKAISYFLFDLILSINLKAIQEKLLPREL